MEKKQRNKKTKAQCFKNTVFSLFGKVLCPCVALFFCLCFFIPHLNGQGAPTSSSTPAPSNTHVGVSPGNNFFESQSLEGFSEDAFDVDSDSINFEEGTFNWKGRTFNLGNSRVIRARFERYLSSPALEDEDEEYLGVLEKIADLLSLVGEEEAKDSEQLNDQIYEAWQLLFVAGKYEMDAGTSLVIANQVYNVWRVRDENYDLGNAKVLMEEEKKKFQDGLVSDGWNKKKEFDQIQRKKALNGHTGKIFEGITEATFQAEQMVEVQARIALIDTQAAANGIQAKLQFQSSILNLLLQRRFEHCLIAASFYRHAFKGSHMNIQVGMEQVKEFMPVSDFAPTVETFELIAREAKNDINTGMKTIDSLFENKELFGALERMQETFFLGEHMPTVLQFLEAKKRELLILYRKSREVQNLADLKDFGAIETALEAIKPLAYDYPLSPIYSAVRSAQRMSNMSLIAAKQAMFESNFSKAERALEKATLIWPLNPAIEQFTNAMADNVDLTVEGEKQFDQLYERKDFRQIFDRSTDFGAALFQNATKYALLKEVIEMMGKVDILIAQAEELNAQDNSFAAWEILLAAMEIEPNDPNLARARARLAPRVANFVASLDTASRAENEGKWAMSLNEFLAAQDIYPSSKTSRLGIERLSEKLMHELSAKE